MYISDRIFPYSISPLSLVGLGAAMVSARPIFPTFYLFVQLLLNEKIKREINRIEQKPNNEKCLAANLTSTRNVIAQILSYRIAFSHLLSFTAKADVVEMGCRRWPIAGILMPNRNKQFKAIFSPIRFDCMANQFGPRMVFRV